MECNREEAVRAKEIAERKFLAKDMKGAKKFALKAQNLYPELEGISQMVMTLEVYISAEEEKMNGESNWYGVLGLTPLADDESIRKQYRRLALLLHPDKNRSIGAEGAFHYISQAWNLLSDNSNRKSFDQRCGRLFQKKDQAKNEGPSPSPAQNGFHNFANTAASEMRAQKGNNSKRNPSASPRPPRKKDRRTFWTVCHQCKMQYEYLRMYLNHNLLCPNCREAYFAIEIDPPSTMGTKIPSHPSNSQQRKNTSQQASDASRNKSGTHHGTSKNGSNSNNFKWVPFSESTCTPSAVQAANMVQQAYEKVKRERQKAQAAARREEALRRKNNASKRKIGGEPSENSEALKRRKGAEDQSMNKEKMKLESFQKCKSSDDVGIKHLVMEKARNDIQKKLNQSISATVGRNVTMEDSFINKKEIETSSGNDSLVTHKLGESLETEQELPQNKQSFRSSDLYLDNKLVEQRCIDVVKSDFHDFDKSRMENCFGVNQVWALYDDDDGMPRHYAMIHNVICLNPFKVSIRWLSSTTHNRIGNGSWFLSGFFKTYGEFGVGRHEICDSIDCFSHKVRWTKLSSKTISIFPRKGDVWALYRNWSPEWNELTEHAVIHEYDIIEVVEDCDEEVGVIVIPLVKVAGFKAVFHHHFDPREIRRIPVEELCRFSHQVPSHFLTKGCLELDPAAVPLEFLQLMSDTETIEFVETDKEIDIVKAVDIVGVS